MRLLQAALIVTGILLVVWGAWLVHAEIAGWLLSQGGSPEVIQQDLTPEQRAELREWFASEDWPD